MLLFDESIKSKYTKKNYSCHLRQFKKFAEIGSTDNFLLIPQNDLQHLLEDYLIELKRTAHPNSIPSKFQGIKHFCVMNGIIINWNIIYKMFPQKQKTQNLRSYTDEEIQNLLSATNNKRNQAIIHFLASTGARIGVFDHDLSIKHIKQMSNDCIAIRLYAEEIEEYWAFLTPQATNALNRYHFLRKQKGEIFCTDTPIFTSTGLSLNQLGWNGVRTVMYRAISKSDILRSKHNDRYNVQINHGFRKRFNTILKLNNSVNYNIAEKLMGHKNGLDGVYFTPTLNELFTEFIKIIPVLEISEI